MSLRSSSDGPPAGRPRVVRATALLALLVALLASGWLAATAQGTHGVGLPLILLGTLFGSF